MIARGIFPQRAVALLAVHREKHNGSDLITGPAPSIRTLYIHSIRLSRLLRRGDVFSGAGEQTRLACHTLGTLNLVCLVWSQVLTWEQDLGLMNRWFVVSG